MTAYKNLIDEVHHEGIATKDTMNSEPQSISLEKAYEVRHWSRVLGWSETELYHAVLKVGKGLTELREYRRTSPPSFRPLVAAPRSGIEARPSLYLVH